MELNRKVEKLKYSLIRVLKEEASKYSDVINLTIGEPDIPTPKELVMEAMKYGEENQLNYAQAGGNEKIRKLVADYYNNKYGSSYDIDNIIMNVGGSEALSSSLKTILNPDDEVMITAPFYPGYPAMIETNYGKTVVMDISKTDFKITKELLEEYVSDKTKAILFSNPCNPSGNVMSIEEMKIVVDFISEREIFLISDEIYSSLAFYDYYSFSSFEKIKDKLITINGFSKSHSMTGWRIGYTICPSKYRKNFLNTSFYTLSCPMTLSLKGAEIALEKFSNLNVVEIYKERAEYMSKILESLGFKVLKPKGAFYIFAEYSKISDLNSLDFAMDILKKVRVAVVPGISFGVEKYIRVALTVDMEKLKISAERLKKYCDELK